MLLVVLGGILNAQTETIIEQKIQKMLLLNGSENNFKLVVSNIMDMQEQQFSPLLSEEFFDSFRKEVINEGYESIVSKLIPVYMETFTEEEIDGIITFLESEVGQALTNKTPVVMEKSMKIGGEWGEEVAARIYDKIQNSNEMKLKTDFVDQCDDFKEGEFNSFIKNENEEEKEIMVRIERYNNTQIEIVAGKKDIKQQIEWGKGCRYILTDVNEDGSLDEDDKLEVNFLERTEKSYKYIANLIGTNLYMEGEIRKR